MKFLAAFAPLLFALAGLSAQEAVYRFGKPLQLPEGWTKKYDPPEVLVSVKALPDSTLSLAGILDGKGELIPLVASYLEDYDAFADSLGPGTEFEAIIPLSQKDGVNLDAELYEEVKTRVDRAEMLSNIEERIGRAREETSFRRPFFDPAEATGLSLNPEPYRAGFFSHSRHDPHTRILAHGFEPHNSLYSPGVYQNYYHSVLRREDTLLASSWSENYYPHEVALSDIEVGIGDYEHRFARGSLRKNKLLGVEGLYGSFDFLVQGGNWLEEESSRDLLKFHLRVPIGETSLELGFADFSSKLPMFSLKPQYWLANYNFLVERSYRTIHAAWRSPWLNLAVLNENDTSRAEEFTQTLRNDALHLKAWKAFSIADLEFEPYFEQMFTQRNFELEPEDHEQLAGLRVSSVHPLLSGEVLAEAYGFERFETRGDLYHAWESFDLGAVFHYSELPQDIRTYTECIYPGLDSLEIVDIREKLNLGGYLRHRLSPASSALLSAGMRNIANTPSLPGGTSSQDVIYVKLGARIDQTWKSWRIEWLPSLTWQEDAPLYEQPEIEYQSHLTLTRLLPHDNALFAGFSLIGHSDYVSSDPSQFNVGTSSIADIWAGVKITNRFELTVSWKNVADTLIYGIYPLPSSLHASLRWFYLN